jgi:integrase
MRWSEIDLRNKTWTIAAARSKNKHAHEVPLSDAVVDIINRTPRLPGSTFVFSTGSRRNGGGEPAPVSGWAKSKAALDRIMAVKMREIVGEDVVLESWHLHDLRRTCATRLGKLGVNRVVIAKVLNHAIPGVTSVYDHHDYEPEKKVALDRWATHLLGIVNGAGDIDFAKARA